jgi:Flp pilus assembly protein TadB
MQLASYCYAFDKKTAADGTGHPYFTTCIVAYGIGLLMAMVASMVMEMGQPALLYIVPSVLLPVYLLSKSRNESSAFWSGSPLN